MWAGRFLASVYLSPLLLFLPGSKSKKAAQVLGRVLLSGSCCFSQKAVGIFVVESLGHFDQDVMSL